MENLGFKFQGFPWFFGYYIGMARLTTLSTNIDSDLKKALSQHCKKHGLKIQRVVEDAIREQLEDDIDLAAYRVRKDEDEIPLSAVLAKFGRK